MRRVHTIALRRAHCDSIENNRLAGLRLISIKARRVNIGSIRIFITNSYTCDRPAVSAAGLFDDCSPLAQNFSERYGGVRRSRRSSLGQKPDQSAGALREFWKFVRVELWHRSARLRRRQLLFAENKRSLKEHSWKLLGRADVSSNL